MTIWMKPATIEWQAKAVKARTAAFFLEPREPAAARWFLTAASCGSNLAAAQLSILTAAIARVSNSLVESCR